MAEWLRRLTRNQLGSARVGSNPTVRDILHFGMNRFHLHQDLIVYNFNTTLVKGGRGPEPPKSSVTGPSLLVNCYLKIKFHKKYPLSNCLSSDDIYIIATQAHICIWVKEIVMV